MWVLVVYLRYMIFALCFQLPFEDYARLVDSTDIACGNIHYNKLLL